MNSYLKIILFLFISATLLCCSDYYVTSNSECDDITYDHTISDLYETFEIRYNYAVLIEEENLLIKFMDVAEGRCPTGAQCFWEGQAECEFLLFKPNRGCGTARPIIRPSLNPDSDEYKDMADDALGYRLFLVELTPYPHIDHPIEPKHYSAKLKVENVANDHREDRVHFTKTLPALLQRDQVTVRNGRIHEDILTLTVSYGGGCGEHRFKLFMQPAFMKSYPAQANLFLQHTNLGDYCEALISEDVSFDIRPIAELYKDMFRKYDEIILHAYGFFSDVPDNKITISYKPE